MNTDIAQTDSQPTTQEQNQSAADLPMNRSEVALAVSQSVLTILKNVSQYSTVPCLQEAATIACTLVQMVQDMKSNKEACRDIVEEICSLLTCISGKNGQMTPSLEEDVTVLVEKLKEFETICHRIMNRKRLSRFIRSKSDIGAIENIRRKISATFREFYMKSVISIRTMTESLGGREDTQTMLYVLEELKKLSANMEKPGTTVAAMEMPQKPDWTPRPMQEFTGEQTFEGEVLTNNVNESG